MVRLWGGIFVSEEYCQMKPQTLFLRKATGLVRAWSVWDAFAYNALAVTLSPLGLYTFSYGSFLPADNWIPAILISFAIIFFLIFAYAMLMSVMPRAGGDYIWQSRILNPFLGFVFSWNTWVSVLWLWAPIYSTMMAYTFISPMSVLLGQLTNNPSMYQAAIWWSTPDGLFAALLIVTAWIFVYVAVGVKNYARFQKVSFALGTIGFLAFMGIMLATPRETFVSAFNQYWPTVSGQAVTYDDVIRRAANAGDWAMDFTKYPFALTITSPSLMLIPYAVMWNIWPNWCAPLSGEVRGASDFRRQALGMAMSSIMMNVLAIVTLLLIWTSMGYEFYNASNYLFWYRAYTGGDATFPMFPYPVLLATLALRNPALSIVIMFLVGLWGWAWTGTLVLSSTRAVFAMAFDRVLPTWFGRVTTRFRTPINCLILMSVMGLILGGLYVYNIVGFMTVTLDGVFVVVIGYTLTCIAAAILPWRKRDEYNRSPISRYKIGGVPFITISGIIISLFLIWVMYMWAIYPVYGVNSPVSALYLLANYIGAAVIFIAFKLYRKKQGIDVAMLYKEIPVE